MITVINVLKKTWEFLTNPKNTRMIILGAFIILLILLLRQCEATNKAKGEVTRIENNYKAQQDTIRNYKDKWGNSVADIRALTLTLNEAKKELEFEKNKPPITVIKFKTKIEERIVNVPVIVRDTILGDFNSIALVSSSNSWGKSSRSINLGLPYYIDNDSIRFGNATIDLKQNIWLTASILRDKKTKEVFVNLSTDYPGTTFNEAKGIVIDPKSPGLLDIQYKSRKTMGIGLHLGYGIGTSGFSPYVGIGINYTPKFLQW
jgi:hypothetical protein